jgi:hypothetical protein
MKCSMLYKEDGLWLIIYACYLWEIALNIAVDALFDNT